MEGVLDCIISRSFFGDVETSFVISMSLERFQDFCYCLVADDACHELSLAWKVVIEVAEFEERIALLVKLE